MASLAALPFIFDADCSVSVFCERLWEMTVILHHVQAGGAAVAHGRHGRAGVRKYGGVPRTSDGLENKAAGRSSWIRAERW